MTKPSERRAYRNVTHRRGFNMVYPTSAGIDEKTGKRKEMLSRMDDGKTLSLRVGSTDENIALSKKIYDIDENKPALEIVNDILKFWFDLRLVGSGEDVQNTIPMDITEVRSVDQINNLTMLNDVETRLLDELNGLGTSTKNYDKAWATIRANNSEGHAFAPGLAMNYAVFMKYMLTPIENEFTTADAPLMELLQQWYQDKVNYPDSSQTHRDETRADIRLFFWRNGLQSLLDDDDIRNNIRAGNSDFYESVAKKMAMSSGVAFGNSNEYNIKDIKNVRVSQDGTSIEHIVKTEGYAKISPSQKGDAFVNEVNVLRDVYRKTMQLKLTVLKKEALEQEEEIDDYEVLRERTTDEIRADANLKSALTAARKKKIDEEKQKSSKEKQKSDEKFAAIKTDSKIAMGTDLDLGLIGDVSGIGVGAVDFSEFDDDALAGIDASEIVWAMGDTVSADETIKLNNNIEKEEITTAIIEENTNSDLTATQDVIDKLDHNDRVEESIISKVELSNTDKQRKRNRELHLKKYANKKSLLKAKEYTRRHKVSTKKLKDIKIDAQIRIRDQMRVSLGRHLKQIEIDTVAESDEIAQAIILLDKYVRIYSHKIKEAQKRRVVTTVKNTKVKSNKQSRLTN